MRARTRNLLRAAAMAACFLPFAACSDDDDGGGIPVGGGGSGGSADGGAGAAGTAGSAGIAGAGGNAGAAGGSQGGGAGDAGSSQGGTGGGSAGTGGSLPEGGTGSCTAEFTFQATGTPQSVMIAGEWHGFALSTATTMTHQGGGKYTASIQLPPGLHAYKLVVDGTNWMLDPGQGRRKYVGDVENSAIKVRDCSLPSLAVQTSKVARPSAGAGTYDAKLAFADGTDGGGADAAGFTAELLSNGVTSTLQASQYTVDASGAVTIKLTGLADGKHRVTVTPKSKNGKTGEPVRLVFWVEAEEFSWKDAIVYMAVVDRYRDGDASNNPSPTAGADPRGDWQGGDLQGLRQSIASGLLDQLGVRAIWITPFQTNPVGAYMAADGVHKVTGYHGYWPTKAREVEPRIGGDQALRDMVNEAHKHGIRILQDYVLNHVHEDHEYKAAHPGWFRTGCVCGTANCDWTSHALDCMFASYLPDINHTVPEANAQFVADAVYWLDDFDLDGLRVDAVKHVEEVSTRNLAAEVREGFESAGTRYFLMGETAMGWSDCGDPCNDENYNTISKYIGPYGLDGQFDFVLYHGVSYKTFAYGEKGMLHADYWLQHNLSKWPDGAIMTPYIGSHDTARFVTLAQYGAGSGIPGNQWDNTAVAPTTQDPYDKMRVGMAWLLTLPGAPLLYYGDEYGQWGGSDPNNRLMWRDGSALDANESATLTFVRKVGSARRELPALRRGDYVKLYATEDSLVFARKLASGNAAIVALTRSGSPVPVTVELTTALGFTSGTALHDRMGGPDVSVAANGTASFSIPGKGASILAP